MTSVLSSTWHYVHAVWQRRYFLLALAGNDLRSRYRRSVLGVGWSLLNPIAMTAVLCVVFSGVFKVSVREYIPWLMTGMAIWTYISAVVTEGCQTFYRSEGYIRSHSAPLGIYPLRIVLGVAFHFLIVLLVTLLAVVAIRGVTNPGPLVSLIPSFLLLFLFGWSVAALAGLANAYFPDTQHLSQIGLQILFYLTPVMYPPTILEERGLGTLLRINPLSAFLDLVREPIMNGQLPSVYSFVIAGTLTLLLFVLAMRLLMKLQNDLIFHL